VPHAAALHPLPDTVHFTAVFAVPLTFAENCCRPPCAIVASVGETVTPTLTDVPIITLALADCVRSARDVATTNTIGGLGALAGAEYKPSEVISPHEMPLQPLPVMLHSTTSSAEPVAVNCNWAPGNICADDGDTTTDDAKPALSRIMSVSTIQANFRAHFISHPS